jgi:hypothetical protein
MKPHTCYQFLPSPLPSPWQLSVSRKFANTLDYFPWKTNQEIYLICHSPVTQFYPLQTKSFWRGEDDNPVS